MQLPPTRIRLAGHGEAKVQPKLLRHWQAPLEFTYALVPQDGRHVPFTETYPTKHEHLLPFNF